MLDEYLVTALVPSETACLASSPGRISRTLGMVSWLIWPRMCWDNSRCLDLPGRDGGLLVVGGKLGCLSGDPLEDI